MGARTGACGALHRAGRGTGPAGPVGRRPAGCPGRGDRLGRSREDRAGHPLGAGGGRGTRRPGCGGCSGGASTLTRPPSIGPKDCWTGRGRPGIAVRAAGRLAAAVLGLLRAVPLLLVLDGLEVVQEGPAGDGFGRLLDGTLREVLAGACQQPHGGLVLLTSRFPFADLEAFDGGRARMLEVPPFTPAEGVGAAGRGGGGWLPDRSGGTWWRRWTGTPWPSACLPGCWPTARPPATWPPCTPNWPPPPAPMPGSARCWSSTRTAGRAGPVPARRGVAVRPAGHRRGGAGRRRARGVRVPAGRVDPGHGAGRGAGPAGRAGLLAPRRDHLRPPPGPRHLPPSGPGRRRDRRRHRPGRAAGRER